MMDIGINYLTELDNEINKYDEIYKFLIKNEYINTLKYPGKYCTYDSLKYFLDFTDKNETKIDIHGIPNMVPSICSKFFLTDINWTRLNKVISNNRKINRISTHLGLENKDKIINYKTSDISKIYNNNIKKMKKKMNQILSYDIDIGIENLPGGFEFDIETLKPDYVSNMWKKADFGVFDITHAKLASEELEMKYNEYLKKLQHKEKVKILHISGDIDEKSMYANKPDKHVLIHKTEINDIIETIKEFTNLDLVVSEYGFNTKYSYEKELIIEAITVYTIVNTMNEKITIDVLDFLEKNLYDDISNIQKILSSNEWKKINNSCGRKNGKINKCNYSCI